MAKRDMILYFLHREGKNPVGPFIAQILGGYNRDVPDEEVVEYVRNMHGVEPVEIERVPHGQERKKRG